MTTRPPRIQTGTLSPDWTEVLYQVAQEFASSLDLNTVLGKILTLALSAVDAETGSIFLLDSQRRPVRRIHAGKHYPPAVQELVASTVMSRGLAGWAVQRQQVGLVVDTETDERWYVFPDDPPTTRSAVAVPLLGREGTAGVLTLQHSAVGHFTKRMTEFLETIAHQASVAIENAWLYTRVANERSTLQAVISGVQDAILVTDPQNRLLLANPAARRMFALTSTSQGNDLAGVLRDTALNRLVYDSARDVPRREVTLADGRVMEASLTLIPDVGKVVGLHDITTFKRLDQIKSEFVASVAHDLKAPLSVVYGFASLLTEVDGLPEDQYSIVDRIIQAATRMRALIDNILDLGKIEMGLEQEMAPVGLGNVVRDAVAGMADLAGEKGIALAAQVTDPLPLVQGDAHRLGQAVSNLLGNALKFTPTGGSVMVFVAMEGAEVVVWVKDSGPGIPPAKIPKLFQKFSKLGEPATRRQEGHGLGLAIVKSVVEAHSGRVWVESRLGEGSTFAFALPIPEQL